MWSQELTHHFGCAESTRFALQEIYDCLSVGKGEQSRYEKAVNILADEMENLFHQACICSAVGAAMPHILRIVNRLKLKDQIGFYYSCGWMHTEGAGWAYESKEVESWYESAVEKARYDLSKTIKSNELDEDDQFSLFFALDAFHYEHYSQRIRNRWEFEEACRQCETQLLFKIDGDAYKVEFSGDKKSKLVKAADPTQIEVFLSNNYRRFLFQVAMDGGHVEFANWLVTIHSPFECPSCCELSSVLPV